MNEKSFVNWYFLYIQPALKCSNLSLDVLAWLGHLPTPWSESTFASRRLSELRPFGTSRSEVSHNLPITILVITRLTFQWLSHQMSKHNLWALLGCGSPASQPYIFPFTPVVLLYFNIFLGIWFHKQMGCVYYIKLCLKYNWKLSSGFEQVLLTNSTGFVFVWEVNSSLRLCLYEIDGR